MISSSRWTSASLSHVGRLREANEDACLERPEVGLWAVADGMGGHAAGALASRTVVEHLSDVSRPRALGVLVGRVCARLQAANRQLLEEGQALGAGLVGSTVAAVLLFRFRAVCIWAGDSRVYRYRAGRLRQLTRDHRQVQEYVEQGLMTPEQAAHHPEAHAITRAVGATRELRLAVQMYEVLPRDRFLLCSDGLYEMVDEQAIRDSLESDDPARTCARLVELANTAGGHDNITVVIVVDGGAHAA